MVPGIRFVGASIRDADVSADASFEPCPVAHAVGIPLLVKREPAPGVPSNRHLCVRFMTDPLIGLAPLDWQYGGCLGDAPPVVAARSDGIPFTTRGYAALDEFMCDKLREGPKQVTRGMLMRFLGGDQGCIDLSKSLHLRFPPGTSVKLFGLRNAVELSGVIGSVVDRYQYGRVGVKLPDPHGTKALKPECLLSPDGRLAGLGDERPQDPEDDCDTEPPDCTFKPNVMHPSAEDHRIGCGNEQYTLQFDPSRLLSGELPATIIKSSPPTAKASAASRRRVMDRRWNCDICNAARSIRTEAKWWDHHPTWGSFAMCDKRQLQETREVA